MAIRIGPKNWLPVLMASLLLSGQTPGWKARIGSENGVKVVSNPSSSAYGEFRFELAENLILEGGPEKNLSFGRVWDVKADDQGNIFVLDSGNQRIPEFDGTGKYLRTIGRQGQGPGEFQSPGFPGFP